jgi:hypothetical protein
MPLRFLGRTGPVGYNVFYGFAELQEPSGLVGYGTLGGNSVGQATLSVSAVPLPAALPLFGSGILALAGFAWRSRGKVSA